MKNIEFNFFGLRDRSETHKSALSVGGEDKIIKVGTEILLDVVFKAERTQEGAVSEAEHTEVVESIKKMLAENPGATFRLEIIPAIESVETIEEVPESDEENPVADDRDKA